jgi:soluble lytic murein transglycosylase-like protein
MSSSRVILGGLALTLMGTFFGYVGAVGGPELRRQLLPDAGDALADDLPGNIMDYVVERNPGAPRARFRDYPAVLLAEAERTGIDHCLALAQAQAESDFRHDAIGAAGEIGIYQLMPATAAIMEPVVGRFRKPVPSRKGGYHDLGDLADPRTNTRIAMAYLRDILVRKPSLRAALTEYNAGPRGSHPHYYRTVMATYVELLERPELQCRFREIPAPRPLLVLVEAPAGR